MPDSYDLSPKLFRLNRFAICIVTDYVVILAKVFFPGIGLYYADSLPFDWEMDLFSLSGSLSGAGFSPGSDGTSIFFGACCHLQMTV